MFKDAYPEFARACVDEGKIWFIPFGIKAIFELDVNIGEVKFIAVLPINEVKYNSNFIGAMIKNKKKLYFAPFNGDVFITYNIESGLFTQFPCEILSDRKFYRGVVCNNAIYFIGQKEAIIAKYDLNLDSVQYLNGFQKEIICKKTGLEKIWSRGTACIDGKNIMIPNVHNQSILKINSRTDKYKIYKLRTSYSEHSGFSDIIYINGYYWIVPRRGSSIICWNKKQNLIFEFGKESGLIIDEFTQTLVIASNIVLLNTQREECYIVNTKKENIKKVNCFKKGTEICWWGIDKKRIYINTKNDKEILEYDGDMNYIRSINLNLNDESMRLYFNEIKKMIITEKMPYISLQTYISMLEVEVTSERYIYQEVGKKTYNMLISKWGK